ncbi:hypothetical protein [Xylella fastidiosa]|uniref:hypothetical protein n=1 Tax=Xylella fastidiosa TaxID=2371 RepID=UPI001EEBA262|nr:hypothetical protein [Xylella fastidiosa]
MSRICIVLSGFLALFTMCFYASMRGWLLRPPVVLVCVGSMVGLLMGLSDGFSP